MSTGLTESFLKRVSNLPQPLTLVVNDSTRSSPAAVLAGLQGALPGDTRVLFATGTHRKVLPGEETLILGEGFRAGAVRMSSSSHLGDFVPAGTTSRGTEVYYHPWLMEGSVLAVNSVEPHYFAGFTGGRKSFLPGCSARRTIEQNHWLACGESACVARLKGNPVHEDMAEGAEMLFARTECLMVNGVHGRDDVFCGPPAESFQKAVEVAEKAHGVHIDGRYGSLKVRPGGSLEINLYQAMKAVFLWESAVADGGSLILEAPCPEGLGAPQMDRLLRRSATTVPKPSRKEYRLGDHAALRLSGIRRRIRLFLEVGDTVQAEDLGFPPRRLKPEEVIENAGFTYPVSGEIDA